MCGAQNYDFYLDVIWFLKINNFQLGAGSNL